MPPDAGAPSTRARAYLAHVAEADRQLALGMAQARADRDVVRLVCLHEKATIVGASLAELEAAGPRVEELVEAELDGELAGELAAMRRLTARAHRMQLEGSQCIGESDFSVGE